MPRSVREVRDRAVRREVGTDAALAQLSGYFLGAAMTRRIFFAQDGAWFGSLPETQGPSDSALLATKAQSVQGFSTMGGAGLEPAATCV